MWERKARRYEHWNQRRGRVRGVVTVRAGPRSGRCILAPAVAVRGLLRQAIEPTKRLIGNDTGYRAGTERNQFDTNRSVTWHPTYTFRYILSTVRCFLLTTL
jgi:hypothetical protein